jgi:hypothetical protein
MNATTTVRTYYFPQELWDLIKIYMGVFGFSIDWEYVMQPHIFHDSLCYVSESRTKKYKNLWSMGIDGVSRVPNPRSYFNLSCKKYSYIRPYHEMMWKMSHMTEVEKYCAIYDKMSDIRNAVKDKLNSLLYFKNKKPRKKINTVEKEECERKLQLILEKRRELNSAHDKQLEKIEENIRRLETFGITITKSNVSGKNVTLTKKDGSKEVMRLVMSMSH